MWQKYYKIRKSETSIPLVHGYKNVKQCISKWNPETHKNIKHNDQVDLP